MQTLRQLAAVLLLLISCVAPAMACVAPDAPMSSAERACCRMMKNDCGPMEMPASHNCCHRSPGTLHGSALNSTPVALHPAAVVAVWVVAFDLFPPRPAIRAWLPRPELSPPKSPPSLISVLRV